jgi:L,D-peptidoglycan transpeptidase YkuD (ErfK/YbiS/YcfS/YnhG family)
MVGGVATVLTKTVVGAVVVAAIVTVGGASAAAPAINGPVAAGARGERAATSWTPAPTCDLTTAEAIAARHEGIEQLVIVATDTWQGTTARLDVAVRVDGTWRCQWAGLAARVGRAGTRPLAERRSGDGTTPAGVFPLGTVRAWDGQQLSAFGNQPDPGLRIPYRSVRPEDCWGATPNTSRYQQLVARPGCSSPDEWLTRYGDVYAHAAVIGANLDPVFGDAFGEPPLAAAIFLHRHSYDGAGATRATSGCVSLALAELVGVLRDLDPALAPHFAIGPVSYLRSSA